MTEPKKPKNSAGGTIADRNAQDRRHDRAGETARDRCGARNLRTAEPRKHRSVGGRGCARQSAGKTARTRGALTLLRIDDRPAVRVQHLPGHVGRVVAGQEHVARRDFVRLAGALHRRARADAAPPSPRRTTPGSSGVQIGPGATAFTRMPFSTSICDSERVKATIAPLVARVVEQGLVALVGGDRRGVDDRRALFQMRQRRLGHEEHAEDVGAERLLELRVRRCPRGRLLMLLGGVVDEDVEPAELPRRSARPPRGRRPRRRCRPRSGCALRPSRLDQLDASRPRPRVSSR